MRWIWFGFAIVLLSVWIGGCASYHKRVSGIGAVTRWRAVRFPYGGESSQQIATIKDQLTARVEQHIAEHPRLTETRRAQLRQFILHRGMTRDEAQLLLEKPGQILTDRQDIEKRAGNFWPEVRDRVQEAWIYGNYTLFFDHSEIFDITEQGVSVL